MSLIVKTLHIIFMKKQKSHQSIDINLNLIMHDSLRASHAVSPLRLKDRQKRKSLPKKLIRKREEEVTIGGLWQQLSGDVRIQTLRKSTQAIIRQYFQRAKQVQDRYLAQIRDLQQTGIRGDALLQEGLVERLSNQKVKLKNMLAIKDDELNQMRSRQKCLLQIIKQLENNPGKQSQRESFVSFLEEDQSKLVTLKNQTVRRKNHRA